MPKSPVSNAWGARGALTLCGMFAKRKRAAGHCVGICDQACGAATLSVEKPLVVHRAAALPHIVEPWRLFLLSSACLHTQPEPGGVFPNILPPASNT